MWYRPSKIGHNFRQQSGSKIEVLKKWQYQKTFFLTDIFQWKKNQKYSNDLWHDIENWLCKSDLGTFWRPICESNRKIIFLLLIFLLKSRLTFAKLHHWGHTRLHVNHLKTRQTILFRYLIKCVCMMLRFISTIVSLDNYYITAFWQFF